MPTLGSLLPRSQRDVHHVQRQGDAWVYDLARILRSETEEPSDGLSQIAACVLATSLPMHCKLLFTKLSPSLSHEHRHDQLLLTSAVMSILSIVPAIGSPVAIFHSFLLPPEALLRPEH